MDKNINYNRELELKANFNSFWNRIVKTNSDYFEKLTIGDFMNLKVALKNIHNVVTYKTTILFLDWLRRTFDLNSGEYNALKIKIQQTKPNSNGYDVVFENEKYKILAEIKCNIPINNGIFFGTEQQYQIEKDLKKLLYGNAKTKKIVNTDYYKFLVIYDFGEGVHQAMNHLSRNFKFELDKGTEKKQELQGKVEFYDSIQNLNKDKAFILYVGED